MDSWKESGIMGNLCQHKNGSKVIVVAIDLNPNALGVDLQKVLIAFAEEKILSGRPVVLVTPAKSSVTALDLGTWETQLDKTEKEEPPKENDNHFEMTPHDTILLSKVVKGWITIASTEALESSNEALRAFFLANIPVLSIYCSMHVQAKRSTERLVSLAGSDAIELEGSSPLCYTNHEESLAEHISVFTKV